MDDPVKESFWEFAKAAGFRREHGRWYRRGDEVVEVLDLQRSQYGPSYYVNLGFWLESLDETRAPKLSECHATVRLEELTEKAGTDRREVEAAFDLEAQLGPAERNETIQRLLTRHVLPVIETGATVDGLRRLRNQGILLAIRGEAFAALADNGS